MTNEALAPALQEKLAALRATFEEMGSVAIALSGGVDSALLTAVAYQALGERMLAVTIHSPVESAEDVAAARQVAAQVGCAHLVVEHDDLENPKFVENPPDRCYHCKLERFGRLKTLAAARDYRWIAEGSNADDAFDYRPGARAVAELQVRSPLAEAGLTKTEIRAAARALGLPVWDRPSAPCLATRFPYNTQITRQGLRQVAEGEQFLKELGFAPVRVRYETLTARLEVGADQLLALAAQRQAVVDFFRTLGFRYVVMDLVGYRSGSMNEVLERNEA